MFILNETQFKRKKKRKKTNQLISFNNTSDL